MTRWDKKEKDDFFNPRDRNHFVAQAGPHSFIIVKSQPFPSLLHVLESFGRNLSRRTYRALCEYPAHQGCNEITEGSARERDDGFACPHTREEIGAHSHRDSRDRGNGLGNLRLTDGRLEKEAGALTNQENQSNKVISRPFPCAWRLSIHEMSLIKRMSKMIYEPLSRADCFASPTQSRVGRAESISCRMTSRRPSRRNISLRRTAVDQTGFMQYNVSASVI